MFLLKLINSKYYNSEILKQKITLLNPLLNKLDNSSCYIKYNYEDKTIYYLVSYKNEERPEENFTYYFSVDYKGKLNVFSKDAYFENFIFAFIHYEKELFKKDKETLINRYFFLSDEIKDKYTIESSEGFLAYNNSKQEVLNLLNKFDTKLSFYSSPQTTSSKLSLNVMISRVDKNFLLSLRIIYKSKGFVTKDICGFLTNVLNNKIVKLSTFSINLSKEVFDSLSKSYLTYLLDHVNYVQQTNEGYILEERDILQLILLSRGKNIFFDSLKFTINPRIVPANIYLSFDDDVLIYPHIDENENFNKLTDIIDLDAVSSSVTLLLLERRLERINILDFESIGQKELFLSYLNLGRQTFNRVFMDEEVNRREIIKEFIKYDVTKVEKSSIHFKIQITFKFDSDNEIKGTRKVLYRNKVINELVSFFENNHFFKLMYDESSKELDDMGCILIDSDDFSIDLGDFLSANLERLKTFCEVSVDEEINKRSLLTDLNVTLNLYEDKGRLASRLQSYQFDEEEIHKIIEAYRNHERYITIDNTVIDIDSSNISNLVEDLESEELESLIASDPFSLPLYQVFKLLRLNKDDKSFVNFNNYIETMFIDINSFRESSVELPYQIKSRLRSYQLDAVKWMNVLFKYKLNGILADDMGLGKTFEAISFISSIKVSEPILIICPKALSFNWLNEFNKFLPDKNVTVIQGDVKYREDILNNIKENNVYITSYDSLKNDIQSYVKYKFSLILLDEAQYIKNSESLKAKAVKNLNADARFALSATPIENSISDIWSIFDFLMPGYLDDAPYFVEAFEEHPFEVLAKIKPFILRRTKKEVLYDLPSKSVETVFLNLNDAQAKIYDEISREAKEQFAVQNQDTNSGFVNLLTYLTRLRQVCVDPSSFLEGFTDSSVKLDYALDLISESVKNGHKILVFSSFAKVLDHLEDMLNKAGVSNLYINGSTAAKKRVEIVDKFNNYDDAPVCLVTLKAGGLGLNLTGADTVIHLDPWWNFAAEEQATDRAYRIGQTKPVTVYKLITSNTIEERVVELQENKKDIYSNVMENGNLAKKVIAMEDIKYILK